MDIKEILDIATVIVAVVSLIVSAAALKASRRGTIASETSAAAAVTSANAANQSLEAAKQSIQTNISMFKRQGVIELHETWRGIHGLDPSKLVTPHVVDAANALHLTASMWNHDIIEREIIYQLFWDRYQEIYDTMCSIAPVPGLDAKLRDLLSPPVAKAYQEMQSYGTNKVAQTRVKP